MHKSTHVLCINDHVNNIYPQPFITSGTSSKMWAAMLNVWFLQPSSLPALLYVPPFAFIAGDVGGI